MIWKGLEVLIWLLTNWGSDSRQVPSRPLYAFLASSLALYVVLTRSSPCAGVDDHPEELSLLVPTSDRTTSRTSSLSSDSSNLRSPNPSDGGGDTPLAQSDEEDGDGGGAEPGPCS